jgi:predicted Zn-dependent protease
VSYNIHNLKHIAKDVAFFGPLDYFSTYLFENHLQIIKHIIQTGRRALQQAVKRLGEYEVNQMSVPVVMEEELVLSNEHHNGPNITGFHGQQYRTA